MIDECLQMVRETPLLFRTMGEDGYLHLFLEPLFTYGIGLSLIFFAVAIVTGERKSRTLALLLLIACCVAVYPYQQKRNEAALQLGHGTSWTQETKELWDSQTERRRHFQYLYYLVAIGALLNLLISPATLLGKGLAVLVFTGGGVALIASLWLNVHETRIFHPELRPVSVEAVLYPGG